MTRPASGNFFEDFALGQKIAHATPRTLTEGDVSLYTALYGPRFAVQSSDAFAMDLGYDQAPLDDLLVFHVVFGRTVPDVSLNAIANLGYADCRFTAPVYPGDTLAAVSEVIGLRELSNGEAGIVWVRSSGVNQTGEAVLDYVRWVMVRKRDAASPKPETHVPELPEKVAPERLAAGLPQLNTEAWDDALAGSSRRWGDHAPGETLDHVDGMTVEEAEHQLATRLFQNPARVHFNQHLQQNERFGRRLVYGGHVISLARALSFNGLANAFHVTAINAGRHVAPCFAGDTVHAWSEVLESEAIPGREDVGALRLRTVATRDLPCTELPYMAEESTYEEGVILDLDYWVALPR